MFKQFFLSLLCISSLLCGASSSNAGKQHNVHKKRMSANLNKQAKKNGPSAQKQLQKKQYLSNRELYLLELTTEFGNEKQLCAVKLVLQSGTNPNMPNARELGIKFDGLPIGNAAFRGNAELTQLLILYGAEPTATFRLGKHLTQPMHCAARGRYPKKSLQGDYVNTIFALYRRGPDPNAGGNRRLPFTPLHLLAMQKRIPWMRQRDIAMALFAVNGLPDKESFDGRTVEQVAALATLPKLVKLLSRRTREVQEDKESFESFLAVFQQGSFAKASLIMQHAKSKKKMVESLEALDVHKVIFGQNTNSQHIERRTSASYQK